MSGRRASPLAADAAARDRRTPSIALGAWLTLSCSGAPLPRETTASNARTDDHWLDGARCPEGPRDDTGLRLEDLAIGVGKVAVDGETVRVHYVARLPDGTTVHDTASDGLPVEIIIGSTRSSAGSSARCSGCMRVDSDVPRCRGASPSERGGGRPTSRLAPTSRSSWICSCRPIRAMISDPAP
jgi:hypothetical protein